MLTFQYFSLTCVNDSEGVNGVNCPGTEAMKMVRSLTEPPADVAVEADAVEADEVPSEVGTVGSGGGGGARLPPPSVDCGEDVVLARSNAILIARYLHRCSTRALDVVLI